MHWSCFPSTGHTWRGATPIQAKIDRTWSKTNHRCLWIAYRACSVVRLDAEHDHNPPKHMSSQHESVSYQSESKRSMRISPRTAGWISKRRKRTVTMFISHWSLFNIGENNYHRHSHVQTCIVYVHENRANAAIAWCVIYEDLKCKV